MLEYTVRLETSDGKRQIYSFLLEEFGEQMKMTKYAIIVVRTDEIILTK